MNNLATFFKDNIAVFDQEDEHLYHACFDYNTNTGEIYKGHPDQLRFFKDLFDFDDFSKSVQLEGIAMHSQCFYGANGAIAVCMVFAHHSDYEDDHHSISLLYIDNIVKSNFDFFTLIYTLLPKAKVFEFYQQVIKQLNELCQYNRFVMATTYISWGIKENVLFQQSNLN